ncbi:hypothetical protein EMIT07CA2_20009 [Brevibacillus sp. IT-7CA2]|uniref:hypothetical protein n=1 Tax=Brevibacillus sp. IT-7CA2 TaxID=3026436 RepID=UPI0039DF33BD
MIIRETILDVLSNSLFMNDERKIEAYHIDLNEHLLDSRCKEYHHIGNYPDAWSSEDKLIIDWYGVHMVFVSED